MMRATQEKLIRASKRGESAAEHIPVIRRGPAAPFGPVEDADRHPIA